MWLPLSIYNGERKHVSCNSNSLKKIAHYVPRRGKIEILDIAICNPFCYFQSHLCFFFLLEIIIKRNWRIESLYLVEVNICICYIFVWTCLNAKTQINANIILWPRMKLIEWLWIVNSNKYVQTIYIWLELNVCWIC